MYHSKALDNFYVLWYHYIMILRISATDGKAGVFWQMRLSNMMLKCNVVSAWICPHGTEINIADRLGTLMGVF